ncbi:unnamed protein product [Rhizophagus irregularis]|nr:unnamed protein product [Rhizophagus irregularis]
MDVNEEEKFSMKTRSDLLPMDIKFIAEGGFSQIYVATWIDGPIIDWNEENQKELNELKIYYNFVSKWKPDDEDAKRIAKKKKIIYVNITRYLQDIASGLENIHDANIIHKDYHSGNIFVTNSYSAITGDLGLKVLQGQKYTKASDIYSFGMIMWELMTGRRPFWDKNHDAELIIEICDGVRPPIVTNAPEGYVELMKECWHSDPNKRPTANDLSKIFDEGGKLYYEHFSTEIIKSPDIGPIINNPNAIYKSRPLSAMIKSAESTRSLKIQRYKPFNEDKRKRDDNLIEDTGNNDKTIKKIKLNKNDDDYLSKNLNLTLIILILANLINLTTVIILPKKSALTFSY